MSLKSIYLAVLVLGGLLLTVVSSVNASPLPAKVVDINSGDYSSLKKKIMNRISKQPGLLKTEFSSVSIFNTYADVSLALKDIIDGQITMNSSKNDFSDFLIYKLNDEARLPEKTGHNLLRIIDAAPLDKVLPSLIEFKYRAEQMLKSDLIHPEKTESIIKLVEKLNVNKIRPALGTLTHLPNSSFASMNSDAVRFLQKALSDLNLLSILIEELKKSSIKNSPYFIRLYDKGFFNFYRILEEMGEQRFRKSGAALVLLIEQKESMQQGNWPHHILKDWEFRFLRLMEANSSNPNITELLEMHELSKKEYSVLADMLLELSLNPNRSLSDMTQTNIIKWLIKILPKAQANNEIAKKAHRLHSMNKMFPLKVSEGVELQKEFKQRISKYRWKASLGLMCKWAF